MHVWAVRNEMTLSCFVCDAPLAGGLDTYGPPGLELCWACWSICGDEPEWLSALREFDGAHYGLGPHVHTYDADGNLVMGATKFVPLPEPDHDGLIEIDGQVFKPDPMVPGLGLWFRKRSHAIKYELVREGLV